MFLFKTSGSTFRRVIRNHKHAFHSKPKKWHIGELVLISKNQADLHPFEKQIRYTAQINNIRKASQEEIESCWPGNQGRWNYIVDLENVVKITRPFDLSDVLPEKTFLDILLLRHIVSFFKTMSGR